MPMYLDQIELELDAVEARGAGRVPQEMVKNPALPGDNVSSPHPEGIHPRLMEHKQQKTLYRIGTRITQVLRRRKEG